MAANRFRRGSQAIKNALTSANHHLRGLSPAAIDKLAQHLLECNRHLNHFEVELPDEATCRGVKLFLEQSGCTVRRMPFKWLLDVDCPPEFGLKTAA